MRFLKQTRSDFPQVFTCGSQEGTGTKYRENAQRALEAKLASQTNHWPLGRTGRGSGAILSKIRPEPRPDSGCGRREGSRLRIRKPGLFAGFCLTPHRGK